MILSYFFNQISNNLNQDFDIFCGISALVWLILFSQHLTFQSFFLNYTKDFAEKYYRCMFHCILLKKYHFNICTSTSVSYLHSHRKQKINRPATIT